ncbi:hypothetical protein V8G54_010065, partial [Vigna mungo]
MPCWEVWNAFDSEAFPVLKNLDITNCPNLRGDLPKHLPALQTLHISNCELLVSSVPMAPNLQELNILNNKTFNKFPFLVKDLRIEGRPMVEFMMEDITNIQPTSLQSLSLRDCSTTISFPGDRLPASLKTLNISGLKKLKFPVQHKHELLESLAIINSSDSLKSLPLINFPNLINLAIEDCEN